jgi:quercetin dioxygenase-like cupin family protein
MKSAGKTLEVAAGTLVTFLPGERHALHGLEDGRMVLMLDPGPRWDTTPRPRHPTTTTVESLD